MTSPEDGNIKQPAQPELLVYWHRRLGVLTRAHDESERWLSAWNAVLTASTFGLLLTAASLAGIIPEHHVFSWVVLGLSAAAALCTAVQSAGDFSGRARAHLYAARSLAAMFRDTELAMSRSGERARAQTLQQIASRWNELGPSVPNVTPKRWEKGLASWQGNKDAPWRLPVDDKRGGQPQ